jgi:hypothetical protein
MGRQLLSTDLVAMTRIPDRDTLQKETSAWQQVRNAQKATVNWRFSISDARTKLARVWCENASLL